MICFEIIGKIWVYYFAYDKQKITLTLNKHVYSSLAIQNWYLSNFICLLVDYNCNEKLNFKHLKKN